MSGSISGLSYSGIYSNPYWNVLHAFPGSDKDLYCKLLSSTLISEKSKKGTLNFASFINKKQKMHTHAYTVMYFYVMHCYIFSFSLKTSHVEYFFKLTVSQREPLVFDALKLY